MSQDKQRKNAVLVYGRFPEFFEDGIRPLDIPECNPNNKGNWMGWTKEKLEEKGFEVHCLIVPEVWKAPYGVWKEELDKINIDSETTLVGLSQGAGAITRYISEEKKRIKKLILVAPARKISDTEWLEFYNFEISTDVKKGIEAGTTIFYDTEDFEDIVKSVEIYRKDLDAMVIEMPNYGHFSFEIREFPELLEEILETY
ncbi:MAG: alpha/beta hydrolase [Candidatus Magasanikbacteria bacterium]